MRTELVSKNTQKADPWWEVGYEEVISPTVEPMDGQSLSLVHEIISRIGLVSSGPSAQRKIQILVSSLIYQSYRLQRKLDQGKADKLIIGWPHNKDYWIEKGTVGHKIAKDVRESLIKLGWLTLEANAKVDLYTGEGVCTGYSVSPEVASYQIRVRTTEFKKSIRGLKSGHIDQEEDERIRRLWSAWDKHPLFFEGHQFTRAYRKYSNYERKRGGRFYGPWTTLRPDDRLKSTIDGEVVAEVDVRAMNLTLLASYSGLMPKPMTRSFDDPYDCGMHNHRDQIKAYFMEAIGSGNPQKNQVGRQLKALGTTNDQLRVLNKVIRPAYPCLTALKKNHVDSEFFAFHEAEIMLRATEQIDLPMYILHDCMICKTSHAVQVADAIRKAFYGYVENLGWYPLRPAIKVSFTDGSTVRSGSRA
ncbi:hypothetical protein N9M73_02605 [Rhodobacteraceae bacterium]|nr:hypothetical protein [Paracoccaceae bacterium]